MSSLIDFIETVKRDQIHEMNQINSFFQDCVTKNIVFEKKEVTEPFNLMLAASDYYYRENFHSDVLAYILCRNRKFLLCFIEYLNSSIKYNKITIHNYNNYQVSREDNRIDVLIYDEASLHCIIIENKINDAGDMYRQIPRYVEIQKKKGFMIDSIVYLSLDGTKHPETETWTEDDRNQLSNYEILYLSAAGNDHNPLKTNFIEKCEQADCTLQEFSFLQQYGDLLEYLRRNNMDYNAMETFYNEIKQNNNYKTALSINQMITELPNFRTRRLQSKFENKHPFNKIFIYKESDLVFDSLKNYSNEEIKIDIWSSSDTQTSITFWVQEPKTSSDLIGNILSAIGLSKDFEKSSDNEYTKYFKFPEEDSDLDAFLTQLFDKLRNIEL